MGELTVSEKQAKKLDVKPRVRLSPQIEKSCLLLSANVSYENTARDLKELTAVDVSHSTQQRLVHRTVWNVKSSWDIVLDLSVDGGKARIRTPEKGSTEIWNIMTGIKKVEIKTHLLLSHWVNETFFMIEMLP